MSLNKHNSDSFWNRKVSVCHLIYLAIICFIFVVVVLLIIPGRINDDAYQNFSFASTITSIVLAVVSIVYSIQSGLSTGNQISNIQSIEHRISNEISKLSGIDKSIREIINPISETVGNICNTQSNIQQTQDRLVEHVEKLSLNIETIEVQQSGGEKIQIHGPSVLPVTLYASAMSYKTGMDLPFHKFAVILGKQATYCEGLLDGLSALHPEKLSIKSGSRQTRKLVSVFDETYFGSVEFWEEKAKLVVDSRLSVDLLTLVKEYYSQTVHPNDSIG